MTDTVAYGDETPTIEVRVYQEGQLVHQELCESEEQAALVAGTWSELAGVECVVEDLSTHHGPEDVLAPEPGEAAVEDDYRAGREAEPRAYERWAER